MTFPLVFISSTLETTNFAQSAENNADPFFIKSDIYIFIIWPCHTRTGNYQIREFDWLKWILTAV